MLFYYIPNLKIIDIEEVGEEVVYTFETNEEIVKGIEAINVRKFKKLNDEQKVIAEQLLQDAIAEYEERRSNG